MFFVLFKTHILDNCAYLMSKKLTRLAKGIFSVLDVYWHLKTGNTQTTIAAHLLYQIPTALKMLHGFCTP